MSRVWKETLSPMYLHETYGVYQGIWMPQMDRYWISDDGIQVTSRLLETKWGKVEHAAISVINSLTFNGENDLPCQAKALDLLHDSMITLSKNREQIYYD